MESALQEKNGISLQSIQGRENLRELKRLLIINFLIPSVLNRFLIPFLHVVTSCAFTIIFIVTQKNSPTPFFIEYLLL